MRALREDHATRFLGGYIIAMADLYAAAEGYRALVAGLRHFQPILNYVENIEADLEEFAGWICACIDGRMDIDEVEQNVQDSVISCLESCLDVSVRLPAPSGSTTSEIDAILTDVDELAEHLRDGIRDRGYALHSVLIEPPRPWRGG